MSRNKSIGCTLQFRNLHKSTINASHCFIENSLKQASLFIGKENADRLPFKFSPARKTLTEAIAIGPVPTAHRMQRKI